MKVLRHFAERGDAHITDTLERLSAACQYIVSCQHDALRRDPEFPAKGRALSERVYAGIGPARPVDLDRRAADVAQHLLQMSLYGSDVWLSLPAAKPGAVVFDCHENITFHCFATLDRLRNHLHASAHDSCRSHSLPLPIAAVRSACFPSILCKV